MVKEKRNYQVIFEYYLNGKKKARNSQFVCEIQYIFADHLNFGNMRKTLVCGT